MIIARKLRHKLKKIEHRTFSLINKLRNTKKSKIKIVAIAKNEAPYLPDWIFHHLYFGVDAIDVYVNNTTDNTYSLAKKLESIKQLTIKDGNPFFEQKKHSPQVSVYLDGLRVSKRQGYTHLLFIDIDEFWTPLDFETDIHTLIQNADFDVMAFEWVHRVDDDEAFAKPFKQTWRGIKARQVKILLDTSLDVKGMNAHNVLNTEGKYILADGSTFKQNDKPYSKVAECELTTPLKTAFLMHRTNRSQLEYVAGLARSTPVQPEKKQSQLFKYNRSGYANRKNSIEISFDEAAFSKYEESRKTFYDTYSLDSELKTARLFVENKKRQVVSLIENADLAEKAIIQKVLKNVTLPEVTQAYTAFKKRLNIE
jgi:hypothetical protein